MDNVADLREPSPAAKHIVPLQVMNKEMTSTSITPHNTIPTVRNRKITYFFSLPREVRDQIYESLVVSDQPIWFDPSQGFLFVEDHMQNSFGLTTNSSSSPSLVELSLTDPSPSTCDITNEIREAFYRHNTFSTLGRHLPQFFAFAPFQQFYDQPSTLSHWIRNLIIQDDGREDVELSRPSFDQLLDCPELRNLEIRLTVDLTRFRYTLTDSSINIMQIAHFCVQANAKFGLGFQLTIKMNAWTAVWPNPWSDLSWLFRPLVIVDGPKSRDYTAKSLKQLITLQLASMSVFKDVYGQRDASQDKVVRRIIVKAITQEIMAKVSAVDSQSASQNQWVRDYREDNRKWGIAFEGWEDLEEWLKFRAARFGHGQLPPLLPDYPAVNSEHHRWI